MKKVLPIFILAVLVCGYGTATADTIYQSDFSSLNDGELRFQDGWLGQTGSIVDSAAGTVTRGPGSFLRNMNSTGVFGTAASTDDGPGFTQGDMITITTQMRYEFGAGANENLSAIGITDGFGTPDFGFEANPIAGGIRTAYSSFGDGSIKVYTGLGRQGFTGADNAFAIFVTGAEGGFDSGQNGGTTDLVSDLLEFRYKGTFTTGGFQAVELVVTNLDTNTVVADASVDNTAALEFSAFTGGDAYYAQRLISGNNSTAVQSGVTFEFDAAAIPEPASAALIGLGLLGLVGIRRRS